MDGVCVTNGGVEEVHAWFCWRNLKEGKNLGDLCEDGRVQYARIKINRLEIWLGCGQMATAGGPSNEVLRFIKWGEFVV